MKIIHKLMSKNVFIKSFKRSKIHK